MNGGIEAQRRGRWGEAVVIAYLRERGWTIVEANFRCRVGEIDLIAANGTYLAFIEVKLRKDGDYAAARESVTRSKQYRIRRTAEYFLQRRPTGLQPRFDVAEVYAPDGTATKSPEITYLENAF